jgi:hypothetical protein
MMDGIKILRPADQDYMGNRPERRPEEPAPARMPVDFASYYDHLSAAETRERYANYAQFRQFVDELLTQRGIIN